MTKAVYGTSWMPESVERYGTSGTCSSGGTVDTETWHAYEYNSGRQSWRPTWTRTKSIYSPASACSGASLPSGCRETAFSYVSSSDDRIQYVTETGSTRSVAGAVSQEVRKHRSYYYGLDTGTCASSGDWYDGLVCRTEVLDGSGNVYSRTGYTYQPSGTYAGLPKGIAGMTTTYTFNGWNAPTQIVEGSAILSDAPSPTASSLTTSFTYNKLRASSRTTLPKGNHEDTI